MDNNAELQIIQDDPYLTDYRVRKCLTQNYFLDLRKRYEALMKQLAETAGGLH